MEQKLQYAVLQYSPSLISGESINLGVIVSAEDRPLFDFVTTKKLARIKEFDDTIDIDTVKLLLSSIKEELETTLENCMVQFDVQSYIQFYVNEYHFSRIIELYYNDFDEAVKELTKMYLPFDFAKTQRPSHADEIRFMTRILKTNNVPYDRNVREIGSYSERITYDFKINQYGIKLLWLKGKDLSRLINDVKAWAWNADHPTAGMETVIIYDSERDATKPMLKSIIEILQSSRAKVLTLEQGLDWLHSLNKIQTKRFVNM